jgi:predicted TIM-barrel fold metal-dependent hydrolase
VDERSAYLRQVPLGAYRPRSELRVPGHRVDRARVPVVDAHNHLGTWQTKGWAVGDVPALLDTMDASNVAAVANLDGLFGRTLELNLDRYDRAHPGRFVTFCGLDWHETADPGFGDRLARSVIESVAAGAKGLKIWKELGLHVSDDDLQPLMPDDPRLAPVWAACSDADIPVLIHTADPMAFFEPLDETNERLEELLQHPDWWFGDRERFPPFEHLMDALEGLVSANPRTVFIGAHVGGAAEDLARVARMLDTYANFHVDIGARIAELGRQPRGAKALMERHPDRVLFGTDWFPPDPEVYAIHFRFLETEDESFPYSTEDIPAQGRWAISGLGLSEDVLRAVYEDNARRLIPGLTGSVAVS